MATEKILLGMGKVTIGTTLVALTRGGGSFNVEREIRQIEADGDRGPVKGRIVIDTEVAKISFKGLDIFTSADMKLFYPGISVTPDVVETPTTQTMTSTQVIIAGDHNDVKWVGKTLDGKAVTINITDAINLGNLEWSLEDKNEVVPEVELTACYDPAAMEIVPWSVEFAE